MKLRALSVVAGVALVVAACGSTEGDGTTAFPTDTDAGASPDGVAPPPPSGCSPACVAPERCSAKGRCLSGAACDDTLDCEKGKVCDPKTLTCVPGGGCGAQAISAEPVPPNLLVVLDRSCSMTNKVGAQTKWQIAVDALNTLTTSYNGKIRFGITLFPDRDGNNCTQAAALPVPVGPGNETKIQTLLTNALKAADPNFPDGPCVTNIDTGMTQAATDPGFTDATRKSFAMLVSDGAQAGCNAGGGDTGTTAAITALAAKGVKTFVVGFGSGVDVPTLNQFAVAGGTPVSGGTAKFYNAGDKASLDAALKTIAALTLSCTFKLGTTPPDPSKLYVFVDKTTPVTRDPAKANGWEYDPVTNQVTLYGQVCTDLQAGTLKSVDIVYGCPTPA
ncbi:MAG TPA: vWA domain-containing protein [Polyangiaceae bacterium]|jgi:hypothetical protein|nr:vWA domain-containing protein [Polyangiaceae bacterium]